MATSPHSTLRQAGPERYVLCFNHTACGDLVLNRDEML